MPPGSRSRVTGSKAMKMNSSGCWSNCSNAGRVRRNSSLKCVKSGLVCFQTGSNKLRQIGSGLWREQNAVAKVSVGQIKRVRVPALHMHGIAARTKSDPYLTWGRFGQMRQQKTGDRKS